MAKAHMARKMLILSEKKSLARFNLKQLLGKYCSSTWNKVIFSDETKINLNISDGKVYV